MNETRQLPEIATLFDAVALAIARLCKHPAVDNEQPLFRLANKQRFDKAPWVFDSALGILHISGCRAIPATSVSALYGIYSIDEVAKNITRCKQCNAMNAKKKEPEITSDLLFGVIALFEQFGVVLRERGSEFRQTPRGKQLEKTLDTVITRIDAQKNGGAQMVLELMGSMETAMNTLSKVTASKQKSGTEKSEKAKKKTPATSPIKVPVRRSQHPKG